MNEGGNGRGRGASGCETGDFKCPLRARWVKQELAALADREARHTCLLERQGQERHEAEFCRGQ